MKQWLSESTLGQWWRWYNSFFITRSESRQSDQLTTEFEQAKLAYNQALQDFESRWSISRYRWRYNEQDRTLRFEHHKQKLPTLIADAQILGSYFVQTKQWHWSWSSGHLHKKSTRDARQLKRFGRQQGQVSLYTSPLDLQQHIQYCQYLHGLSLHVSSADYAYCGLSRDQHVYFLLRNVRPLDSNEIIT